jgi:uncharacterized membrane protein YwaF
VIEYFIPPTVASNPYPIFAHVDFYNADIKAHKERMSKEILLAFLVCKNYGVPKDLTKHFVNKYIKRGVEYGNHRPQASPILQVITILLLCICIITLIICLLAFYLQLVVDHEPVFKCIEQDGHPPNCEYVLE